jgi:signal transduction histidine kinase/CheY-like chemotaxis protein
LRIDLEATIAGKSGHETTVFRVRHRAGHWNWVEVRRRLVRNERGEAVEVVGIIRDVTERKRLEEHLRQSQKMEAVGQLTGGIAHDFNNLLTVILGNAEMLTDDPTDAALAYGLSRQILNAAERGADLIQKLLAFGRRQSLKPERLKLSSAVDKMVPLLHRTMGEHIELKTDLHEGSLAALIDQTLLESAILNLVVNARDAMPRQGTLTIRTGERLAGPAEGALPMGQPVVYVTVSDTGAGIAPDVLPRVFEPFFTTKEVGKGSGLGLSMVYGFAEQTGGHVSIASQEGVGTSVTIVLPGVAPATSNARQDEKAPTLATPTARILVVEDQPEVLKFASSLLLSLGYEVEAVSTGPDALEVLTRDSRFDLLFSDVVLPKGMSGVELAQRAREVIPGLKVLLTSGYSEDVFEHHGRPDQGTPLLRKPYRRKDLAAMLTKVLASEQAFQGSGSEVVAFPGLHERRRA